MATLTTTPTDGRDGAVAEDEVTTAALPPPPPAPDAWADLPPRERGAWLRRVAPWAIAVLATIVAATSTWMWLGASSGDEVEGDVSAVAGQFLTAFVNWDASDGLDEVLLTVRDLGTEGLLSQLENDELPPALREQLTQAQATSSGEVLDLSAGTLDGEDGHAVAYALVQQVVSSSQLPQPQTTCGAAHVSLQLDEGRWKVSGLDVFDRPGSCPILEG